MIYFCSGHNLTNVASYSMKVHFLYIQISRNKVYEC